MNRQRPFGALNSEAHYAAARRIAEEGIVLLKNAGDVLPVNLAQTRKIVVVGENAVKMMTVGGGSSSLKVQREVSLGWHQGSCRPSGRGGLGTWLCGRCDR